jgi:hypothetical protein
MIQRSVSLERRLLSETVRHAGSLAVLRFYHGTMPPCCEFAADGEWVETGKVSEATIRAMATGSAPTLPDGADYWRLMDNGGNVVMQGNGQ